MLSIFFKECRQYLGLSSYQGTDLDAQIADCTALPDDTMEAHS
jgi:hypothetical protein